MKEMRTCEEIFLKLSGLYYSMLPVKGAIKISKKIAEEKEKGKQKTTGQKKAKAQIKWVKIKNQDNDMKLLKQRRTAA